MAYNSLPMKKSIFASLKDEPVNSFSNIRRTRVDEVHNENNMSPRSRRRKINTFLEGKVLNNKEATALVFEEMCKSNYF